VIFLVTGAAAWVPDALRGAGADDGGTVVVGGVDTGGGDALTFGVFSHGGHGAWYSPLPLGGEVGDDFGGDQNGGRVVGVLRLSASATPRPTVVTAATATATGVERSDAATG